MAGSGFTNDLDGILSAAANATASNTTYVPLPHNVTSSTPYNSSTPLSTITQSLNLTSAPTNLTTQSTDCSVTPYNPGDIPLQEFAPYDASQALVHRYRQQQGVNLGAWFVQEQWMEPSLFTCAAGNQQAELDVAQGWGGVDNAKQVLEQHWDTWITEKDFAYLASIGESDCCKLADG